MSDDSEDFGPLQANTPNKPRAVPSQSKPGSSRAAGEAGPSRVTNNKARKKTATAEEPSDDDEVQEIAPRNSKNHPQGGARGKRKLHKAEEVDEQEEGGRIEDDEDVNDIEEIEQPRTKKARAAPKKPPSTAESTAFTAKGKGKQKARTRVASRAQKAARLEAEPMDLDAIEIPDDDDAVEEVEVANEQVHFGHVPRTTSNSRSMAQNNSQLQDSLRKNDRLEKELRQARKHIDDLRRQVEEAHQVRQTEPEQLMERMEVQHKAELTARDDLNRQYAEQLAQKEPLFSSSAGFELFTREQVKRETLHLEQQIKDRDHVIRQHEQNLKKKDEKLKMKDQEIEELKEDKRLMKLELDAEIERVKQLSSKNSHDRGQTSTQSRTRAGNVIGSSSDPKYSKIISFYEDLTNIIVPYMKSHPGKYPVEDTDDWVLRCLYVHKDVVNKQATNGKSLSFDLRLVYDLKPGEQEPVTSQSQLVQSVQYTPLNLDMGPPEFRDSLGFLGDNFTFERDQLSLFVRTLYDYMSGEANEKGEGDEDDSVQFVE